VRELHSGKGVGWGPRAEVEETAALDARFYVYGYVLLSVVYGAGCVVFINAVTRAASVAKRLVPLGAPDDGPTEPVVTDVDTTTSAVRALLDIESIAFAFAVLPVAYMALTVLLGNLLVRNASTAGLMNPLWIALTCVTVVVELVMIVRIIAATGHLDDADEGVMLTPGFVSRQRKRLSYYRAFILAVTLFNVLNSGYLIATIGAVVRAPYIL
jgi:hypothetical protein